MAQIYSGHPVTITSADGSRMTLNGCSFEMSEVVIQPPQKDDGATIPFETPKTLEVVFTAATVRMTGAFRHMMGLHSMPRRMGRSARQQEFRRRNSLARYYGRIFGEPGLSQP